ncbi:MAG TPA: hypothetical protein VIV12_29925 [Streptosporangiaceae bacterium]
MSTIDPELIRQAVCGAERTTGRTRRLWLALFRLLCGWYRE